MTIDIGSRPPAHVAPEQVAHATARPVSPEASGASSIEAARGEGGHPGVPLSRNTSAVLQSRSRPTAPTGTGPARLRKPVEEVPAGKQPLVIGVEDSQRQMFDAQTQQNTWGAIQALVSAVTSAGQKVVDAWTSLVSIVRS